MKKKKVFVKVVKSIVKMGENYGCRLRIIDIHTGHDYANNTLLIGDVGLYEALKGYPGSGDEIMDYWNGMGDIKYKRVETIRDVDYSTGTWGIEDCRVLAQVDNFYRSAKIQENGAI